MRIREKDKNKKQMMKNLLFCDIGLLAVNVSTYVSLDFTSGLASFKVAGTLARSCASN